MLHIIGTTVVVQAFFDSRLQEMDLSRKDLLPDLDSFNQEYKDLMNDFTQNLDLVLEDLDEMRAKKPFAPLNHEELVDFNNYEEIGNDIDDFEDMLKLENLINHVEPPGVEDEEDANEAYSWSDGDDNDNAVESDFYDIITTTMATSANSIDNDELRELIREILREELERIVKNSNFFMGSDRRNELIERYALSEPKPAYN